MRIKGLIAQISSYKLTKTVLADNNLIHENSELKS